MPSFKGQEDEKDSAKETKMEDLGGRRKGRETVLRVQIKRFQGGRCDQLCHMPAIVLSDIGAKQHTRLKPFPP